MQTAEELQRRIHSATDLFDIVRTMKSLAAVNISHSEKAVSSINEYYRTILLGLQGVLQFGQAGVRRQKGREEEKRYGIVVFGSDQGMCGGFNDKIVDYTLQKVSQLTDRPRSIRIICIGARAASLLEAAPNGPQPEDLYPVPRSLENIVPQSQRILLTLNRWQQEEAVNTVLLFHHRITSGLSYTPKEVQLLPLANEWYENISRRKWSSRSIPIFTMNRDRLFSALMRQYLFVSLYRAYTESMASENGARLSSMQAAEKNIREKLEELTSKHRQQRQEGITSELLDIVSGFEALKAKY